MKKALLNLTPTHYLCPYCGEWHKWTSRPIAYHDETMPAQFYCDSLPSEHQRGCYKVYFGKVFDAYFEKLLKADTHLYVSSTAICSKAYQDWSERIPLSRIIESKTEPVVTFRVSFTPEGYVGKWLCSSCGFVNHCLYAKLGSEGYDQNMIIKLGFKFDPEEYQKVMDDDLLIQNEMDVIESWDVYSPDDIAP